MWEIGIQLAVSSCMYVIGWIVGRAAVRDKEMPIRCQCKHASSFHEKGTGRCRRDGCKCQVYVGPIPISEYYAPPIDGNQ